MSLADVQRALNHPPLMVDELPERDYIMVGNTPPIFRLKEILGEDGVNKNEFLSVMKSIYGDGLMGRVQGSGLMDKWPVKLERRHCLETLAVIGHSVTLEDLNGLWAILRELPADHPLRQYLGIDTPTLYHADQVEMLSTANLQKLMGLLRNPLAFLEPHNPKTLWQEISAFPKTSDKKLMAYTRYDHTMDQLFSMADRTKPEFPFAPHEHLAKFVAYARPTTVQTGMIIPVFTNNETVYYKVEGQINSQGLHAYLFTPVDGNPAHPAQLVFRGTHGYQSISRDMNLFGVGKAVFEKNVPAIIKMVQDAAAKNPDGLKLEISGHSLGAADAQRAMASLVDLIVKEPSTKLSDLKLFAFSSPKLDSAAVQDWQKNIKTLADREHPPRIQLNFAEHESDIVTRAGDMNIGSANAKFVEANYLLVKSKSGIANSHQHHTAPFFQFGQFDYQTDERTFLLFQDREYSQVLSQIGDLAEKQLGPEDQEGWRLLLNAEEALTAEERELAKEACKRLAVLDAEKSEIESSQKGAAQHSWLVWGASMVAQPLKLLVGLVTSAL